MADSADSNIGELGTEEGAANLEPALLEESATSEDSSTGVEPVVEAGPVGISALIRRKVVWIPTLAVLVLALAGGGAFYMLQQKKAEEARVAAARAAAARRAAAEKKLVAEFDEIMEIRAKALAAEADCEDAVKQAKAMVATYEKNVEKREKKVKKLDDAYDKEYQRVQDWNSDWSKPGILPDPQRPDYPDPISAPDFATQVKALKAADGELREVTASLSDLDVSPSLEKLVSQLKEASGSISDEALHNADALTTAVEPPKDSEEYEDYGYLDKKIIKTLRTEASKAIFTIINDDCLKFVKEHKLDIRLYDLAGGRDVDGADSSMLTSGGLKNTSSE